MEYKIALIPGDGIGPEIVSEAKKFSIKYVRNTTTLYLFRGTAWRRIY